MHAPANQITEYDFLNGLADGKRRSPIFTLQCPSGSMYIFKNCSGSISSQAGVGKMCHLMFSQFIRSSSTTEWQQLQCLLPHKLLEYFFSLLLLSDPESRVLPVKYLCFYRGP